MHVSRTIISPKVDMFMFKSVLCINLSKTLEISDLIAKTGSYQSIMKFCITKIYSFDMLLILIN